MARSRLIGLLLALITLLVYLPVWQCGFIVFDDADYVLENRQVQAGLTWEGIRWAFTSFQSANWHPLTWLSHMLDSQLFGPSPGPQHLVNVLLHVVNSVLLFRLMLRLTNSLWPAAFIAAVFAWHPLHVESVAWISERKDVLSTLFGLLAMEFYVRYARSSGVPAPSQGVSKAASLGERGRPFSPDYWLALFWFVLSLMAKPMLVTLPFVLLLLDAWPLKRWLVKDDLRVSVATGPKVSRLWLEKVPFFLLTTVSCVVTFLAQRAEAMVSLDRLPMTVRAANSVVSYGRYLAKTFWPTDLAIIYPLTDAPSAGLVVGAVFLLLGISAAVIGLRRRAPYLAVGWCWYLGMLVPVIGIVQVGGQALADRYMYLPMTGIMIMLAFGWRDLMARHLWMRNGTVFFGGISAAACLGLTLHQLTFWRDSETLFRHAIAATGENEIAEINLGVSLEHSGRKEEAVKHYYRALSISPGRFQTHNDIANVLADLGQQAQAREHYLEALRLKPDAPLARQNFGTLLVEMGEYDAAMREYAEAARLKPESSKPHYLMGKAKLRQVRTAEAIGHFREALKRDADDFQALTYLARVLATAGDPALRNGSEAVVLAGRANELTGGEQPLVVDVLAMAYAEAGNFEAARQTVQRAVKIANDAGATEMIPGLEERLRLYQSGRPFREGAAN